MNVENNDKQLPSHARVVIIGGGIMGCGLAYHLAHEGWTDVVLLEKAELTSGSSWHAAGQITYSTSSYTLAQCVDYNLRLFNGGLEAETGQSVTWHGCGSLRMAYNQEDMDWLRHCLDVGKALGLNMELLSVADAKKVHPFYNFDGIIGALHTPDDGHCDPSGLTLALAAGARQLGTTIIRRCRATNTTQLSNGHWKVQTTLGDIECEHVVNAGGCYARQMGEWNDLTIASTSMTHHYFVTEPVPEFSDLAKELPVVRDDRSVSGYIRMEQKSGLIGIYEKDNINTVWENECPWEAENELFAPDYDRVGSWLEEAFNRVPVLQNVGIRRVVHGAIPHPPDGNPLIGPAAGVRNYWCCCGTQIAIGWGPALTRELARWMIYGSSEIDMHSYDPRRFGDYATVPWQVIKGKEDYSLRHEIPYPRLNRLSGRPLKTSAIYDRLKQSGAVFGEVYGTEQPRWFAPEGVEPADIYGHRRTQLHGIIAAEVEAVRNRAGIMDVSAFGKVELSGADARQLLDNLTANQMPKRDGSIILSHMLNRSGTIDLELTITRLSADCYYLVCGGLMENRLMDKLKHNQGDLSVSIVNKSSTWNAITLQGPLSRKILSAVTSSSLSNADFRWLSAKTISISGHELLAMRVSYCGELGWEIHGTGEGVAAAYDAIRAAGTAHGIGNYGSFAMNVMRMEKAYHASAELTNEVTLPESGLWRFARTEKGDFIGREKTYNAMNSAMPRSCVYLEIEPDGAFDGHGSEAVLFNSEVVGSTTSVEFGHTTGKIHAFAFVHPRAAVVDTNLDVSINNRLRRATVKAHAAYDPEHLKPRSDD